MTITLDLRSPEVGWEPFVDWCRREGIDPTLCRSLSIVDEGVADVEVYLLNENGEKYLAEPNRVATAVERRTLRTPPPLHPSRST